MSDFHFCKVKECVVMNIDWLSFTPGPSLIGGMLIGLAASLLLLGQGRVLGASGILHSAFVERAEWRRIFIASVFISPLILMQTNIIPSNITPVDEIWRIICGGLLVGFGAQLGSGCTSGHGICGLARLSKRSLVAVVTFMVTAMLTVALLGTGINS